MALWALSSLERLVALSLLLVRAGGPVTWRLKRSVYTWFAKRFAREADRWPTPSEVPHWLRWTLR